MECVMNELSNCSNCGECDKVSNLNLNDIIPVTVLLFPDGNTYWFGSEMGSEHASKICSLWKSKSDNKYQNEDLMMCMATLKMFEDDYTHNLSASNEWALEG